ncbi:hypothetical protein BJX70DRAFT_402726 [Aspergillus crustosus]
MRYPSLRSLCLSDPLDLKHSLFRELDPPSPSIRKLRLSVSDVSLSNLRALLASIAKLQVFYLDIDLPSLDTALLGPGSYMPHRHRKTIKELHITLSPFTVTSDVKPASSPAFAFWTEYTALAILTLPDVFLYNDPTYTEGIASRLSRTLRSLTISIRLAEPLVSRVLKDLLSQRAAVPNLRDVTIAVDNMGTNYLRRKLGKLQPSFTASGIRLRLNKVGWVQ